MCIVAPYVVAGRLVGLYCLGSCKLQRSSRGHLILYNGVHCEAHSQASQVLRWNHTDTHTTTHTTNNPLLPIRCSVNPQHVHVGRGLVWMLCVCPMLCLVLSIYIILLLALVKFTVTFCRSTQQRRARQPSFTFIMSHNLPNCSKLRNTEEYNVIDCDCMERAHCWWYVCCVPGVGGC